MYTYKIFYDNKWKEGRVEAPSLELAASYVRKIHQLKDKENTIVLNEEKED